VSRRRELAVLVAAGLLVTAAAYLLLVRPKAAEVSAARADQQQAADESQTLQAQIKALEDVRANAGALRAQARTARSLFPGGPDLPDLVDALQKVADQSGVELASVQPSTPTVSTANPDLADIDTTVEVNGGYFQIEDFLARLEGMVNSPDAGSRIPPRSVLVRSLTIANATDASAGGATTTGSAAAASSDQLKATVGLVAFQSARASAGSAGGGATTGPGTSTTGAGGSGSTPGARLVSPGTPGR
jgi:Tfp pilus assembly protein PilO